MRRKTMFDEYGCEMTETELSEEEQYEIDRQAEEITANLFEEKKKKRGRPKAVLGNKDNPAKKSKLAAAAVKTVKADAKISDLEAAKAAADDSDFSPQIIEDDIAQSYISSDKNEKSASENEENSRTLKNEESQSYTTSGKVGNLVPEEVVETIRSEIEILDKAIEGYNSELRGLNLLKDKAVFKRRKMADWLEDLGYDATGN